jgi:uncharacterized protein (TIGR00661 family)
VKVLYGLCSWGIGHATRSLPIIRKLISEGNELTVATSGRALSLLKNELKDEVQYINFPEFPNPYTETDYFLMKFSAYIPLIMAAIARERLKVSNLTRKNKYKLIVGDHAYGFNSLRVPSYLLMHQARMIVPKPFTSMEPATELFNYTNSLAFKKLCLFDFEENGLAGRLAHDLNIFRKKDIEYMGPTSSFRSKKTKKDIDYLISISGPEPQRSVFQKKLLAQIEQLKGNIVVTLGKPEDAGNKCKSNVKMYNYMSSEDREDIMNRAKLIIARSGYSTVCDVAELGAKAFFVPTPQQTEQEYLGEYLKEKGWYHSNSQKKFDLVKDVKKAQKYKGYPQKDFTKKSVENFMRVISN